LDSFLKSIKLGDVELEQPLRYAISDRSFFPGIDLPSYLESLFRSSADLIQWRERDIGRVESRELVRLGVELSRQSSQVFLVNTDYELAMEEGADGVHLSSDQDLPRVFDEVGGRDSGLIFGKSAHSVEEALSAEAEGADYVTLSPIYEPYSKENDHGLLGLTTLRNVAQILTIPVFALGGVDLSRMEVITAAGAAGIAGTNWVNIEISSS
jgi:thiamine-phosphate pyrophosphorylase